MNALVGIPDTWYTGGREPCPAVQGISGWVPYSGARVFPGYAASWERRDGDVQSCWVGDRAVVRVWWKSLSRVSDLADSGKWVSNAGLAVLELPGVTEFVAHFPGVALSGCARAAE